MPDSSSLNLINISGFLMSPHSHTILPFNDDLIPISENGGGGELKIGSSSKTFKKYSGRSSIWPMGFKQLYIKWLAERSKFLKDKLWK